MLALNRLVAHGFRKVWPLLGISWFDHRFDYLLGPGHSLWSNRGIVGANALHGSDVVLDLCCGDGFFSCFYFAPRASHIDAVDRDAAALRLARRHAPPHVHFFHGDVVKDPFPRPNYDVVFLFSALEDFPVDQGAALLQKIARCLKAGTILGSAPVLFSPRKRHAPNEFVSPAQLRDFLQPHFRDVELFCPEAQQAGHVDWYFQCRGGVLLSCDTLTAAITAYRGTWTGVRSSVPHGEIDPAPA